MEEKFKGSTIIKLSVYLILFLLTIVFFEMSITVFNDETINLLDKFKQIATLFVITLLPFILLAIKVAKYYILINKDYIEVNGIFKKRTIRFEDICEIKTSTMPGIYGELEKAVGKFSGINIVYKHGDKQKKAYYHIAESNKDFKKIYEKLMDLYLAKKP
jgi:hypothetical protein